MKIKPGDLFEWVYTSNNLSMKAGEDLYSSIMYKWISGVGMCLCIGAQNQIIHWISDKGLFCTHINELAWTLRSSSARVVPRKIQS